MASCALVPEVMHGDMSFKTALIGTPHCNGATGVCSCRPLPTAAKKKAKA